MTCSIRALRTSLSPTSTILTETPRANFINATLKTATKSLRTRVLIASTSSPTVKNNTLALTMLAERNSLTIPNSEDIYSSTLGKSYFVVNSAGRSFLLISTWGLTCVFTLGRSLTPVQSQGVLNDLARAPTWLLMRRLITLNKETTKYTSRCTRPSPTRSSQ